MDDDGAAIREVGELLGRRTVQRLHPTITPAVRDRHDCEPGTTSHLTGSTKFTAKCNFYLEREEHFGIPTPDGWSVGVAIQYKCGK